MSFGRMAVFFQNDKPATANTESLLGALKRANYKCKD